MLEVLQTSKTFITNNPVYVTWGVVFLLLMLGVLLQKAWIKECLSERKLNKLLGNLGLESLHNVTIPDGMDGNVYVEHLILTPCEILLISVKRYRGLIFAAKTIDLWTQVVGQKSYKFENPLHHLENDISALNAILKHTKVHSKVLFVEGSEFPKGKPDDIVSVEELKLLKDEFSTTEVPDALMADWKRLADMSSKDNMSRGEEILLDKPVRSGLNILALLASVSMILFWLVWRLN